MGRREGGRERRTQREHCTLSHAARRHSLTCSHARRRTAYQATAGVPLQRDAEHATAQTALQHTRTRPTPRRWAELGHMQRAPCHEQHCNMHRTTCLITQRRAMQGAPCHAHQATYFKARQRSGLVESLRTARSPGLCCTLHGPCRMVQAASCMLYVVRCMLQAPAMPRCMLRVVYRVVPGVLYAARAPHAGCCVHGVVRYAAANPAAPSVRQSHVVRYAVARCPERVAWLLSLARAVVVCGVLRSSTT